MGMVKELAEEEEEEEKEEEEEEEEEAAHPYLWNGHAPS